MTVAKTMSLAYVKPILRKYAYYEEVTLNNRENYFRVSDRPITKLIEDDMELLSDIVTWGELYLHCWDKGMYVCARCSHPLYSSVDKWKGPCVWPSFRTGANDDSLSADVVHNYNSYVCTVKEVYCSKCDLFIGHQFEDAIDKGDDVALSTGWRH